MAKRTPPPCARCWKKRPGLNADGKLDISCSPGERSDTRDDPRIPFRSFGTRASGTQEIEHCCLREHRLRNAVTLRARTLLHSLRSLQIGAEMAGALADAATQRHPLALEAPQRRLDVAVSQRRHKRLRIIGRLGHTRS